MPLWSLLGISMYLPSGGHFGRDHQHAGRQRLIGDVAHADLLGLPDNVANGTNRVGVIMQNIVGITTYQRAGALDVQGSMWYTAAAVLASSIVGKARIAVDLNEQMMNMAIGVAEDHHAGGDPPIPSAGCGKTEVAEGRPGVLMLGLFFVIGIYGGFIQAGVGIFLLAALVMGWLHADPRQCHIKLVIVLALSLAAIAVFIINGQVNWWFGLLMARGQSIGAHGGGALPSTIPTPTSAPSAQTSSSCRRSNSSAPSISFSACSANAATRGAPRLNAPTYMKKARSRLSEIGISLIPKPQRR
ncbi:MAG: sulfite exporter TauE/SafE family protein [Caldilineaceae bacterium]